MTTGDLNEISVAIGRLQSNADAADRQRATLFDKLDDISRAVAPLAQHIDDDRRQFADHSARIQAIEGNVNRAKGAIWAAGIFGSVGGFLASKATMVAGLFK